MNELERPEETYEAPDVPEVSRYAHSEGESDYEYYCRLFPEYDPRD